LASDLSLDLLAMSAWPGVHVGDAGAAWLLGRRAFSRRALGLQKGEAVPDLSVEPNIHVLTVLNPTCEGRAVFVSVRRHACRGAGGVLARSRWRDEQGRPQFSTTMVIHLSPKEVVDACVILGLASIHDVDVVSDIVPLQPPPLPAPRDPLVLSFPLSAGAGLPFRCSQAAGGALTHFAHPSTWHACDFDAPVGTPVLAASDGTIAEVRDGCAAGGGADTSLFFAFNSVVQLLPDGTTTLEYVHIRAGSAVVRAGDPVRRGQRLCESGDAGFCPTPHLHLEAHAHGLADPAAPSLPLAFAFEAGGEAAVEARAGAYYDATRGEVPPPPAAAPVAALLAASVAESEGGGREGRSSGSGSGSSSGGWETVSDGGDG